MGDRIEAIYVVGPEAIEWQAQLACLTMYGSAHLVAAYFDLSADDLEAWANDCAATHLEWFEPDAAP